MPGRDFLFGFKFLATDYVSSVLKKIEGGIARVNAQVKATASWREFAENSIKMGAGAVALGAGVGMVVKSFADAATEMQTKIAAVGAVTGLTNSQLAQVQEHFEKFSESHFAATAVQGVEVFGRLYQNLHNTAAAMKATDDAIQAAAASGANLTDIVMLMNSAHENLGTTSTAAVNGLAATIRQYSLGAEQVQQLTTGIAKLSPSIKLMGGNVNDAYAIMGQAEQSMPGRGAQMIARLYEALPGIANKAHLNLTRGTFGVLDQIQARIRGLAGTQQINVLAGMGMDRTVAPEFLRQLAVLDKMKAARNAIASAGGSTLAAAEATNAGTLTSQIAMLANSWENLKETLGAGLLPALTSIVSGMSKMLGYMRAFAAWSPITKYLVEFAAFGSVLAGVAGGVLMMTGAFIAAISYLPAMATLTAAAGGAFSFLGSAATFAWAAVTGPIGLAVGAIALVGVAVYEVYEHWAGFKAFFKSTFYSVRDSIWHVENAIVAFGPRLFTAGINLVKAIGAGIAAGVMYPIHAIENVFTKVSGYLPFSPAKEGPLRNLNRIRIVETIAESIRPGPALAAIRRTAAAIAIAAPMTFAPIRRTAAAIAIAAPMTFAPSMVAPAMAASARGGAGGTAAGTTIVYSPTIHMPPGSNAADVLAVLRTHSRELKEIIEKQRAHESRREF